MNAANDDDDDEKFYKQHSFFYGIVFIVYNSYKRKSYLRALTREEKKSGHVLNNFFFLASLEFQVKIKSTEHIVFLIYAFPWCLLHSNVVSLNVLL